MKSIKPYVYFYTLALIIFILSLFYFSKDESVVLNFYDTYHVISYFYFALIFTFIFFIFGIIYWIIDKMDMFLIKSLSQIHIISSIVCFFIYFLGLLYFYFLTKSDPDFPLFDNDPNKNLFIKNIIYIFFLMQIIFMVNLIISIFKHLIINRKS